MLRRCSGCPKERYAGRRRTIAWKALSLSFRASIQALRLNVDVANSLCHVGVRRIRTFTPRPAASLLDRRPRAQPRAHRRHGQSWRVRPRAWPAARGLGIATPRRPFQVALRCFPPRHLGMEQRNFRRQSRGDAGPSAHALEIGFHAGIGGEVDLRRRPRPVQEAKSTGSPAQKQASRRSDRESKVASCAILELILERKNEAHASG
jgi:hypothetical protein